MSGRPCRRIALAGALHDGAARRGFAAHEQRRRRPGLRCPPRRSPPRRRPPSRRAARRWRWSGSRRGCSVAPDSYSTWPSGMSTGSRRAAQRARSGGGRAWSSRLVLGDDEGDMDTLPGQTWRSPVGVRVSPAVSSVGRAGPFFVRYRTQPCSAPQQPGQQPFPPLRTGRGRGWGQRRQAERAARRSRRLRRGVRAPSRRYGGHPAACHARGRWWSVGSPAQAVPELAWPRGGVCARTHGLARRGGGCPGAGRERRGGQRAGIRPMCEIQIPGAAPSAVAGLGRQDGAVPSGMRRTARPTDTMSTTSRWRMREIIATKVELSSSWSTARTHVGLLRERRLGRRDGRRWPRRGPSRRRRRARVRASGPSWR